jgi:hypothetical protein
MYLPRTGLNRFARINGVRNYTYFTEHLVFEIFTPQRMSLNMLLNPTENNPVENIQLAWADILANSRVPTAESILPPARRYTDDHGTLSSEFYRPSRPSATESNVKIGRLTTLARMYIFDDIGAYIEYPESDGQHPIGYLFRCDPNNWEIPSHNFAYTLGSPSGHTRRGQTISVDVLRDSETGEKIPCTENHYTCTQSSEYKFTNIYMHIFRSGR